LTQAVRPVTNTSKKTRALRKKIITSFATAVTQWTLVELNFKLDSKQRTSLFHFFNKKCKKIQIEDLHAYFKRTNLMIHYRRTNQDKIIQEIPDKSDLVLFTEFPEFIEARIRTVTRSHEKKSKRNSSLRAERLRQRIYWGLMQSKSLTAQIPKCMIQACYEKHRNILTQNTSTEKSVLEAFREFIRPVVNRLTSEYRNKTYLATNHASFEAKRSDGGIKTTISDQLSLSSKPFWAKPGTDRPRLEPTMYVLSGEPGCGKSTLIEEIITRMQDFLGTSYAQTVYHRNTNTDHWDGYCEQPIVVYDDFGQAQAGENQNADDTWEELITLNSSAQYLVPMADLKSKGQ